MKTKTKALLLPALHWSSLAFTGVRIQLQLSDVNEDQNLLRNLTEFQQYIGVAETYSSID